MQVIRAGIVALRVAVGGDDDTPVTGHRVLDRLDRARTADKEGDDIARKDDDILERQQRITHRVRCQIDSLTRPIHVRGSNSPDPRFPVCGGCRGVRTPPATWLVMWRTGR